MRDRCKKPPKLGLGLNFGQVGRTFNLAYDYCSLMHVGRNDLWDERKCIVTPNVNPVVCHIEGTEATMGQRIGLSSSDKETIRRKYSCVQCCVPRPTSNI